MELPNPPEVYAKAVSAILAPTAAQVRGDHRDVSLLVSAALDEISPDLAHSAALVLIEHELSLLPAPPSFATSLRSSGQDEPIPTLASSYLTLAALPPSPAKKDATLAFLQAARSFGERLALHSAVVASWCSFVVVHEKLARDPLSAIQSLALEMYELQ